MAFFVLLMTSRISLCIYIFFQIYVLITRCEGFHSVSELKISQALRTATTKSSQHLKLLGNPPKASGVALSGSKYGKDDFSFGQRIESVKSGVVGALAGGVALTPFTALHDIAFGGETVANGPAQWEFDTDTGSLEAALFAIVYRYCVRKFSYLMID